MKKSKELILKSVISFVLAIALIVIPLPQQTTAVWADGENIVESTTTTMTTGIYRVSSNVTVAERIAIDGNATLILDEGMTLTALKGIEVTEGNALTIEGYGTLNATGDRWNSGIGSSAYMDGNAYFSSECGVITINGGNIIALGGNDGAGIGGVDKSSGNIYINGGTVMATGGYGAAGIGGGNDGTCGTITITEGVVTATGGEYGAGIGSGSSNSVTGCESGIISISGGTIVAAGGDGASGIGGGRLCSCDEINISGGIVTSTGGEYGAGIGSGEHHTSGIINITGGQVTANADEYAAGIGQGSSGYRNGVVGAISLSWENEDDFVYASSYDDETAITLKKEFYIIENGLHVEALPDNISGKKIFPLIARNSMKIANINGVASEYLYTGNAIDIAFEVFDFEGNRLEEGTDYTGAFSPLPIKDKGYYTLTITAIDGGRYIGEGSIGFFVTDFNLNEADVSGIHQYYPMTGNEISLEYTVTDSDGVVLIKDLDYTESYSPSPVINAGDYTLVITAKDGSTRYKGSKSVSFTVVDDYIPLTEQDTVWDGSLGIPYRAVEDVTIDDRIMIAGDVRLILDDGKTFTASKGIELPKDNKLTIDGEGILNAISNDGNDAAIGAKEVGTLIINSGIINAFPASKYGGAGIGGSSRNTDGGTIIINGGTVTAKGGYLAAGIGGGAHGVCGTVIINGGKVTANGYSDYMHEVPGIGPGYNESGEKSGTITVGWINEDDYIHASSISDIETLSFVDGKKLYYVDGEDYVIPEYFGIPIRDRVLLPVTGDKVKDLSLAKVTGLEKYYAYTGRKINIEYKVFDLSGKELVSGVDYTGIVVDPQVINMGSYTLNITPRTGSGYTGQKQIRFNVSGVKLIDVNTRTINGGIYKVSNDVSIDSRIVVNGDAVLILSEGKTLNAKKGIEVTSGNKLTIEGKGTLIATGDNDCAGIGSSKTNPDCGTIIINGGNIDVTAGSNSAAIGGGSLEGRCGLVMINGGRLTATGWSYTTSSGRYVSPGIGPGVGNIRSGTVILGWTDKDDFIYASNFNYVKDIAFAEGKQFYYIEGDKKTAVTIGDIPGERLIPFDSEMAHDFENVSISGVKPYYLYTGENIDIKFEVVDLYGERLIKNEDYVYEFSQASINGKGEYLLTVTAKDGSGYNGSKSYGFEVVDYIPVTVETVELIGGYGVPYKVIEDITIDERINIGGDVDLILGDGITLTASKGIELQEGHKLTINGKGTLNTMGEREHPGIGGWTVGTLIINDGIINARGGYMAAGIGGAFDNVVGGTIIINGGTVNTVGGAGASGIGGGYDYWLGENVSGYHGVCGTVIVNGGKVTANSTDSDKAGYGIGPGYGAGKSGSITLGWTNEDDFIHVNGFGPVNTIVLTVGKSFYFKKSGSDIIVTLENIGDIGGSKLLPYISGDKADAGVSITEGSSITKVYGDDAFTLTAKVTYAGTNGTWSWTSSDENNVIVDNTGRVTIKGASSEPVSVTATYDSDTTEGSATIDITVNKAAALNLSDINISERCGVRVKTVDVSQLMPADAGTLRFALGTLLTMGEVNVIEFVVDASGAVWVSLSDGTAGDTVSLPICISSDNYEDSKATIIVTLTDAHEHIFDKEVVDAKHLKSAATCISPAVYYKSCQCGEKGIETFTYGTTIEHDYLEVAGTAKTATCTEAGKYADLKCSMCGDVIEGDVINAHGHAEENIPAVAATCTEPGKTAGKKCSVCDTVIVAPEDVPALGHNYTVHEAHEATYTEDGNTVYWSCDRCGKYFSDAQGNSVIEEGSWVITKLEPTATATPVPTATATPVPKATATPVPTATATPVPKATATPVPTATATPVPKATATPVPTATATSVPSETVTSSPEPTVASTPSPTSGVTKNTDGTITTTTVTETEDGNTVVKQETSNEDRTKITTKETTTDDEGNVIQTVTETFKQTKNTTTTEKVTETEDKKVTETVKETKKSTTTETVIETPEVKSTETVVEKPSGEKTATFSSETADGTSVQSVETTSKTGEVAKYTVETKADGSVTVITENYATDGSSSVLMVLKDAENKTYITSQKVDAEGNAFIGQYHGVSTADGIIGSNSDGEQITVQVKLLCYESDEETVVIPSVVEESGLKLEITAIAARTFYKNKTVKEIVLSEGVEIIGKRAFAGASNLKEITIYGNVKKVYKYAFKNIAKDAVIRIIGTKKQFKKIRKLIRKSGFVETVKFEWIKTSE